MFKFIQIFINRSFRIKAAESVNNFFGNIANSLSGGNSFLNDVFDAVANATSSRVNDKFGFDNEEEARNMLKEVDIAIGLYSIQED